MKENQPKNCSRRHFLSFASGTIAAIPLLAMSGWLGAKALGSKNASAAGKEAALPPGLVPVPATDPVAMALGYKADKKDVDAKKYPQIKKPTAKNQNCQSCNFYTKVNEGWGKCQMITSGAVASGGWCGSWSKKA